MSADTIAIETSCASAEKEGPLTWGQKYIWRIIKALEPDDSHINISGIARIDRAVDRLEFADVMMRIVEDFDILRTSFPLDHGGHPWQRVGRRVLFAVQVERVEDRHNIDERAETIRQELEAPRFNIEEGPIARFSVIYCDDRPQLLVFAASHMTMDAIGRQQFVMELESRFAAEGELVTERTKWQPYNAAAYEAGPDARQHSSVSLEYWERALRTAPVVNHKTNQFDAVSPRYWHGKLKSEAIDLATAVLSRRFHVSEGTVLLATLGLLISVRENVSNPLIITRVSNRLEPEDYIAIGHFSQDAPYLAAPSTTFCSLLVDAHERSFDAYQNAQYDPDDLATLIQNIEKDRSASVDRGATLNCMKTASSFVPELALPDHLSQLAAEAKFEWIETRDTEAIKIFVYAPQSAGLSVFADTTYLTPAGIVSFAFAFQQILIDAALGIDDIQELVSRSGFCAASFGLTPKA